MPATGTGRGRGRYVDVDVIAPVMVAALVIGNDIVDLTDTVDIEHRLTSSRHPVASQGTSLRAGRIARGALRPMLGVYAVPRVEGASWRC
jgi:hypothetical protein